MQRGHRALTRRPPARPRLDCAAWPTSSPSTSSAATTTRRSMPGARACGARAEEERGPGGLEIFDARAERARRGGGRARARSPSTRAPATCWWTTRAPGRPAELAPLEAVLAAMPPDTVLVLIVARQGAEAARKAVEKAGGEVREYAAPKPWELPKWAVERARELGLQLDKEAAKELVALVGDEPAAALARAREARARAASRDERRAPADVEELAARDDAPAGLRPRRRPRGGRPARPRSRWPRSSRRTASGPGGSCSRSCGACARCTAPPRCSRRACRSRRWPRRSRRRPGCKKTDRRAPRRPTARRSSARICVLRRPRDRDARRRRAPARTRTPRSRSRWPARPAERPALGHCRHALCGGPLTAVGVPPLLRRDLRLDVHVLGLLEGLEALLAELAPEARTA